MDCCCYFKTLYLASDLVQNKKASDSIATIDGWVREFVFREREGRELGLAMLDAVRHAVARVRTNQNRILSRTLANLFRNLVDS